jgi:hypothetical protein
MPLNVDKISTGSLFIDGTEVTPGGGVKSEIIFVDMGTVPGGIVQLQPGVDTISNVFLGDNITGRSGNVSIVKLNDGSFRVNYNINNSIL